MSKPNCFIIGAPKCGTTAMSEYLRSHPAVFMCEPKEPHFFCSDVRSSPCVENTQEYLNLFRAATPENRVVIDASADYLMSERAPGEIASFAPNAKIIIMLRKPSDLVSSFHNQLFKFGVEDKLDFEQAWDLQGERARGNKLPKGCKVPKLLQYKRVGELGHQVEDVLMVFPADRVHFILLDDFVSDPTGEYLRLLAFLDLPDDGRREFPRVNEAVQYKWPWLGQFPKRMRGYVAKPLSSLRRNTRFRGTGALRILDRLNTRRSSVAPVREEFRCYLDSVFYGEVKLLEELLDRDLSAWRADGVEEATP